LITPTDLSPAEYAPTLELLKTIDFFKGVADENIHSILFSIQKQTFGPQKTILFQGEIANQLFIIRKGKVTISTKSKGSQIILAELSSPKYFGEISLLTPSAATANVYSGEEGADLLIISHEVLDQMTKQIPDIKDRIRKIVAERLDQKKKAQEKDQNE
jgi:CRP-like cAMP-binding protein